MTSAKLKYLLYLTKEYPVHNSPSEIRRIVNLDAKSNSKNKKVASTIDSKDINEIIQILKNYTSERVTAYMQQLEAEESAIVLERANTPPMTEPPGRDMPFRFDPTIPDVGSTENFGAYRHPGFRHRPRSPRRQPPAPIDTAYLDALDSTDSVMGPWALSVADPSHILPQHRYGMRGVVHPPAPAPYSHDASVSTISSPRGHRRAAAYSPSLDVIPPSSHARADFVDVPPGIGVRGRGARAASPASPLAMGSIPRYHAIDTELPLSRLSIPGKGRGALQHSELDMVRYDTGSSVAPLSRSHSRPPSLLNSVDYFEHPQHLWELPGASSLPPIPPPASAARPPSASASAAKAASPKSMVSPKAKKQQQKQAWMLGMFDSAAEKVARPDTEEFDFNASASKTALPEGAIVVCPSTIESSTFPSA